MKTAGAIDAVLQYGATFDSTGAGVPVFLFCDSNTLFSARQPPSWGSSLTSRKLEEAVRLEGNLYKKAAAIFTMSEYIADSFVTDFGLSRSRVVAVGAGPNVDPDALMKLERVPGPQRSIPTVLFIGREFERKGGDVLIAAFQRVRAAIPDARLLVIGPKQFVELPEGGEWLGFLDRTSPTDWPVLRRAFESATVFTLPARHEPFGLVVLEAMYAGLPVVATRIGALQEMVVDGATGVLVTPGNCEELADALIRLLNDPASAQRLGSAGRERAAAMYSWTHVTSIIADRANEVRRRS